MNPLDALYPQFDPTKPLEADQEDLYVDWQKELGPEDVKLRLANSIARSGGTPVTRLFTGHRGVGKTTELKRVKQILEEGKVSRKLFVSMLQAEKWMDLQDVRPPDIVFQIVRQLVDDLDSKGFGLGRTRLAEFFKEFRDLLNQEVELKSIKIPTGFAEFGFVLKDVPVARSTLRKLLEGSLPTIYDLINDVIRKAKDWLREKHGFEDILVIVDELDRIPQKVISEPSGLTNHESIFLDHARVLRFLECDALYTIPIELAYSHCHERLKLAYSTEILTLPVIPVKQRDGQAFKPGLKALCEIVKARVSKAGVKPEEVFGSHALLEKLCTMSGGHVRLLFVLIRSAIERCAEPPITDEVVTRTIKRQANDIALPLGGTEWDALEQVHRTKGPAEHISKLWYGLLRDLFVFAYEDETGIWYDWNPLLGELRRGGA